MSPESGRARVSVAAAAAGLTLAAVVWLSPGLDDVGLTWDEPHYFASVVRIQDWVTEVVASPTRGEALSAGRIAESWDRFRYWNPHPPAYKEAMAVTEALFGRRYGAITGYRLAPLLLFALLVGGVVLVAGRVWGLPAGIGAGLSLLLLPRVVGHAHLGATDTPLSLFWFVGSVGLAAYATRGGRWHIGLGALGFGLAMSTKFTGFLLPVPMLVWLVAYARGRRAWLGMAAWGILSVAVAYAANPIAWHDPAGYTAELFRESLRRADTVPIFTYYLGRAYGYVVPWHHPVVMTLATVPVPLLVLSLGGALGALPRWRRDPLFGLCAVQVGFFLALLALPGSPNHDGVRLFLPMFPFLALLAGAGFATLLNALRPRMAAAHWHAGALVLGALFFLPPYLQTIRVAPYYLSYYNELVGGLSGAANAGMEVTYWHDAVTPEFLRRLNDFLPPGAPLSAYPNHTHYQWLQQYGMLRADLDLTAEPPTPYFLLMARKAVFNPFHEGIYRTVRPALAVEFDGVELVGLYVWSDDVLPEADAEVQ